MGDTTIAQSGAEYFDTSYSVMKSALVADAKSISDAAMVAGLPIGNTYSKLINGTWESETFYGGKNYVQQDVDQVEMTRANAKAIGLVDAHDKAIDATIIFNSEMNFDFDASNGINSGYLDFIGVALHEIGHALGFESGVDVLDFFSFFDGTVYSDADYSSFASPLDFTRCSDESAAKNSSMDWTVGNTPKHFSIDGTCSASTRISNAWATGLYQGDGFEASHWKNNIGLGIMNPSATHGEFLKISNVDILAFDVIGWDVVQVSSAVPEPSSLAIFCVGLVGFSFMHRRKKYTQQ